MRKMIFGTLSVLLFFSLCSSMPMSQIEQPQAPEPDCFYNVTQLIRSKGYECEEHRVITPDGYILGVQRIPRGRNAPPTTKPGPPVLLQHGLLDSAATWAVNFPDQSLSYILADAGYDVWLGNMRGNKYSRAHVKYDPRHDEEFWDFSYDEMANIDLPSMAFYILNATQRTHIAYVGHSQGTMIGFAQFGQPNSVLQNNVSFWTALAPVGHLGHIKSPMRYLSTAKVQKDIELYWHILFGRNEFLPSSSISSWLEAVACGEIIVEKTLCNNLYFLLFGPEKKNLNETRLPVYVAHEPDGTSVKNMIHFAQGVQSNIFQAYNYSTAEENMKHYNQSLPPLYTVNSMKVPTAVFFGGDDWLADPTDVQYLFDNIPSETLVFRKYLETYDHADFLIAITANRLIYDDLLNLMKKYHPLD